MSKAFDKGRGQYRRDRVVYEDTMLVADKPAPAVESKAYESAQSKRKDRSVKPKAKPAPEIKANAEPSRSYRSGRLISKSKIELPSEEGSVNDRQVIVSPAGTNKTEWADADSLGGPQGEPGLGIPEGGFINQHLVKQSGEDYDTAWRYGSGSDPEYPENGLKGAVLRKVTDNDNHVDWSDPTGGDPQARPPRIGTRAVLNGGFF